MSGTRLVVVVALSLQAAAATLTAQQGARTLVPGEPVRSHLEVDGPGVETWRFDGTAGDVVSFTARSEIFRPTIHLVSPAGEELARDDEGIPGNRGRDDAQLVARLPTDGEYLARVAIEAPVWGGAYEAALRIPMVAPLEPDRPARGHYDVTQGHDLWRFEGRAGQVVSITVRPAGFTPVLQLMSPTGEHLAASDRVLPHRPAQLLVFLPVDGRYIVGMHDAFFHEAGAYEIAVRTLTTEVRPAPVSPSAVGEPAVGHFGDRRTGRQTPMLLEMNGPAVADERDVKLWSFEGAAGDVVRVTAHGAFMAFDVMSPAGEIVAMNDGRIAVRLPLDGRYLVRVRAVDDGDAGRYAVAVSAVPLAAQAPTALRMNTPASGLLNQDASGVGMWAFEGSEDQAVSIGVNGLDGPVVQLLLPTGEEIGWAYSAGVGHVQLDARLPTTGKYLIRVLAHVDFWTVPNAMDYEIEVRRRR